MNSLIISSLLATSVLAAPYNIARAYGSKAVCNTNSSQAISFFVGPQKETVLPQVCKNLQCPGEICIATINYPLVVNATTTYPGTNILEGGNKVGDKYSAWFTVHPPSPAPKAVTWTKENCFDFFNKIATDCAGGQGISPGNYTVTGAQGDDAPNGATVEITIFPAGQNQTVVNNNH